MKTIYIIFTLFMFSLMTSIFGQFSRQQAIDLVMYDIVDDDAEQVDSFFEN